MRHAVNNNRTLNEVVIDPHCEAKHFSSMNDQIILDLVKQLDGRVFEPDVIEGPFSYFVTDKVKLAGKFYKLIWLLEDDAMYIGVINAFRRSTK